MGDNRENRSSSYYNKKYPGKEIKQKYYKGLGSSSDQDIMDTFGQKMVELQNDENTSFNMNKIFHTKQSDARKKWLENYDVNNVALKNKNTSPKEDTLTDHLEQKLDSFNSGDRKQALQALCEKVNTGQIFWKYSFGETPTKETKKPCTTNINIMAT